MRLMTKFFLPVVFSIMISIPVIAQDEESKETPSVESIGEKLTGMDETISLLQSDVTGLKKFKFSGYFQFEWLKTEDGKNGFGLNPYDSTDKTLMSQFRLRRGRVKLTYDGGLTQFVFQGDFTNSGFALKDLYMDITDPWTKYFALRAGLFNRPNYEVEYSSSQRESMERSLVIRTLYPNERDLGAMITVNPDEMFVLQLAAFNNTVLGPITQRIPNFRNEPMYYMARLTKSFTLADDMGLDIGVHTRIGNIESNSLYVIESDQNKVDSTANKIDKRDKISKTWFGGEFQFYWDILGGMKIIGEYITGSTADEPKLVAKTAAAPAIRKRDFMGYYVMLVKNIGEEFQVAVKYDVYDPNTAIADDNITSTSDLMKSTIGFGLHNYSFTNVRISLWYEMITTQTGTPSTKPLFVNDPIDNLLTLRFQYKF
jgi:hypothetical protein